MFADVGIWLDFGRTMVEMLLDRQREHCVEDKGICWCKFEWARRWMERPCQKLMGNWFAVVRMDVGEMVKCKCVKTDKGLRVFSCKPHQAAHNSRRYSPGTLMKLPELLSSIYCRSNSRKWITDLKATVFRTLEQPEQRACNKKN